ncbi:PREDICTED: basic salivary proline-rich protein 2-like [Condylura cristata]|uniref:basic salivary proline-rich protein 2-like n=1 Tax=Condylura cristata TaxID=143302 RepID=UPI000642A9F6|nr:PREDICTED: basic salivary proline-rich protein 2-like [Condylura cristata]
MCSPTALGGTFRFAALPGPPQRRPIDPLPHSVPRFAEPGTAAERVGEPSHAACPRRHCAATPAPHTGNRRRIPNDTPFENQHTPPPQGRRQNARRQGLRQGQRGHPRAGHHGPPPLSGTPQGLSPSQPRARSGRRSGPRGGHATRLTVGASVRPQPDRSATPAGAQRPGPSPPFLVPRVREEQWGRGPPQHHPRGCRSPPTLRGPGRPAPTSGVQSQLVVAAPPRGHTRDQLDSPRKVVRWAGGFQPPPHRQRAARPLLPSRHRGASGRGFYAETEDRAGVKQGPPGGEATPPPPGEGSSQLV